MKRPVRLLDPPFIKERRNFEKLTVAMAAVALGAGAKLVRSEPQPTNTDKKANNTFNEDQVSLFLCGDVMTGRAIDQVLPYSVHPRLFEPYITDARQYVLLAEAASGSIPKPVDYAYPWGDALTELARVAPALRIVNLETAVTANGDPWPRKGIHYRMHPANIDVLKMADIDCCVLANNHVLDWGYTGLTDTLQTLNAAGIQHAGAGHNKAAATQPAILTSTTKPDGGRVLVFAFASATSGVPPGWSADDDRAGVSLLKDESQRSVDAIAALVGQYRRTGDVVVASIHWGGNWGYGIARDHKDFAHALIDRAAVDVVHGHSSHHAKGLEVYREKLILYGCGDFINDYEGISGYEEYRSDLCLMYFPTLDAASGNLVRLQVTPMQTDKFRLRYAALQDKQWLHDVLNREGVQFGTWFEVNSQGRLELRWN